MRKSCLTILFISCTILAFAQQLSRNVIASGGDYVVTPSITLSSTIGEYTKKINLEDHAKGVYFLQITTNTGIVNKELVLQ